MTAKAAMRTVLKRAYPYIRFSSPEQRKGNSLERQLERCREWCQDNNAVLDESLEFMRELGHTAFDGSNLEEGGGLGLFLAAVQNGDVEPGSYLLVEKLDRFSRTDIDVAISFFGKILRAGIIVVSMQSGTEYTSEMLKTQPTNFMTAVMEFILANEESVKKSYRLNKAWKKKRELARAGKHIVNKQGPNWLRLDESEGTWEILEDKAATVQRIYEETANGIGAYRLAAMLNNEKIPTLDNEGVWSQDKLNRILRSKAPLGEFQPQRRERGKGGKVLVVDDGPPIENYYPRILEDSLYYAAWDQIRTNTKGGRPVGGKTGNCFLFSKLAYDAISGSTMVVHSVSDGTTKLRYIIPSSSKASGKLTSVPAEAFEEALLSGLSEIKPEEISPSQTALNKEIAETKGQLAELSHHIEETALAMRGKDPKYLLAIIEQVENWGKEKEALAEHLRELNSRTNTRTGSGPLGELKTVVALLKNCKGEECDRLRAKTRALVRSLVKRVDVRIRAGKDRFEKHISVLVTFRHCAEARLFSFLTYKRKLVGVTLVMSGYTLGELQESK